MIDLRMDTMLESLNNLFTKMDEKIPNRGTTPESEGSIKKTHTPLVRLK